MGFAKFMASFTGRLLRIILGTILIIIGMNVIGGTGGAILAIIGLVPLIAGIFNFCVFAPLLKVPFRGKDVTD